MSATLVRSKDINHESGPSLSEVVESLGFGRVQILLFVLCGGNSLIEATCMTAFNCITLSVARDLGLSLAEQGMLTTMGLIGILGGVTISGYIADSYGRRIPTLLSYALTAVCMFAVSVPQSWFVMTLAGLGTGFGIGFGQPATIAFLSEVTPENWRMMMRAGTSLCFVAGALLVTVVTIFNDPTLEHLNYRLILQIGAIPALALFVLSAVFLPESPVFLASIGKHEQAAEGFKSFARRNGRKITGTFEPPPQVSKNDGALGVLDHLKVIFSSLFWYATLANTYAVFCAELNLYGTAFASPQIFAKTSPLPAAWQNMVLTIPSVLSPLFVGLFADYVSRRTASILASALAASVMFATCVGGGVPLPRPPLMEALYQYGVNANPFALTLGLTVCVQLSVEIYPSTSAAFGASFVNGFGRLGAIIAPEAFEVMRVAFGHWESFYSMVGILSCIGMIIWIFVNPKGGKLSEDDCHRLASKDITGYMTMIPSAAEPA